MESPPTANRRTKSPWASSKGSTTKSASSNDARTACATKSTFGSKYSPACCRCSDTSPSFLAKIHPHDFTKTPKILGRLPCDRHHNTPHCSDRASAERLGLAAQPRVGLTTFLQNSNEPAALARGLTTHVTERKLNDARNREVVQCPKGLRLHPTG